MEKLVKILLRILKQLKWIFEQRLYHEDEELPYDLEGLTIIGNSGAGKTYIVKEFMRRHSRIHHPTFEEEPVGYCVLKDSVTGLKGLYSAILSAYGHPYGDSGILKLKKITIDQLEETLLHILKNAKTQLLFIDEFQHARGRNQQAILNQLKRTMLVSHIPFVPIGIPQVSDILQLDSQLADRCPITEYSSLNHWHLDKDFRSFLAGYERFLPFPEPSNLSSGDRSRKIFEKVIFQRRNNNGRITNLRRVVKFLKKAAINALMEAHECILEEVLDVTEL